MKLSRQQTARCLALAGVHLPTPKPSKYHNRKVTAEDGTVFDSVKEYRRYLVLKAMERDGLIRDLKRQVRVPLVVNGQLVCTWIADAAYFDVAAGCEVHEDTKSEFTRRLPTYRVKAKLYAALFGREIREV